MSRTATTIFIVLISLYSFAQKNVLSLEKLGLKPLKDQLSYIPAKSFNSLVHTGSDSVSNYAPRISSVAGFYISKTEVTNKEYREFVYYTRDSIAHTLLQHFAGNEIDWGQRIDWNDDRLVTLMLPPDESFSGRKVIDPAKIYFAIDFFGKKETISIYPDTLVWMRDFSYSYNEPLAKKYFMHSNYDNYPVVGISLKQAMAFCKWKTGQYNKRIKEKDATGFEMLVRLPSNAEWESSAFEEKDVENIYVGKKDYNCNFGLITGMAGVLKKDFKDDGYFYTSPVKNYPPGPFGLYDMKGNVAEWTSTSREEVMKAEVQQEKSKIFFVVKGGGWNSTPFYLQAGVCQFYPIEDTHTFIGFRYVAEVRNNK
ncbi:MAG: formylglycine-generating enzyme family protein [Chitinophagaceae bacterium]